MTDFNQTQRQDRDDTCFDISISTMSRIYTETTKPTGFTPVAAYCRASSKDQKDSIPLQKAALQALAKRYGYTIVKWYTDYGKSGAKDQEKREQFQLLLRDCSKRRFKIVICYDQSRFSRLDCIEVGSDLQVLRQNDILLHTLLEGVLDLNCEGGD
jgi:DNA invertase Pin-like site-specific DNA recombinase